MTDDRLGRVDVVDHEAQRAGIAAVEGEREARQVGVLGVFALPFERAGVLLDAALGEDRSVGVVEPLSCTRSLDAT